MTIKLLPTRNEYTATAGQQVFTYTFKIFESTDIVAYVTPPGQEANDLNDRVTILSVTDVGSEDGGTVTISPVADNSLVTLVSDVPENRTTDYQNNGDFRPNVVNNDFDRVVTIAKQAQATSNRALVFQESQQNVQQSTLPKPEGGKVLRWKADETGVENLAITTEIVSYIESFNSIADLIASVGTYTDGQIVSVLGYSTPGDGGGQDVFWDSSSTDIDNGGSIFKVTAITTGRFLSEDVNSATVEQFGAIGLSAASQAVDHSDSFQNMFDSGIQNLSVGPGHFMIDAETIRSGNLKEGVGIRSNTNLTMTNDTYIHALDTEYTQTNTFFFYLEDNLTWTGGNLVGDLDARAALGNFNTIGFRVQGSNNVTVRDVTFRKHATDGYAIVYETATASYEECNNVNFLKCSAEENYRNGASVIGCNTGSIIGGSYSLNVGTIPAAGIDVEPNANRGDGSPSVVDDFVISGIKANSNGRVGIAADAAGTISRLSIMNCKAVANGIAGINTAHIKNSIITGNTATGNPNDIVTWGNDNVLIENNIVTQTATSSASTHNMASMSQGVHTEVSGSVGGIKVPDNINNNLGVEDFTLIWRGSLPDWTPAGETYFAAKTSGINPNITGVLFALSNLGHIRIYFYQNDGGTIYTGLFFNPFEGGSAHEIAVSVTREQVGVDGSINIYYDGYFSESVAITAAAPNTLDNTGDLVFTGLPTSHQEADTYGFSMFNYALTADNILEKYQKGISFDNKWGTQSPLVFGCLSAYEPEGVQPAPGQWLDSSGNKLHAALPATTATLAKRKNTFELRGKTSWVASTASLHLCGFDQNTLPDKCYIEKIIGVVSGATVEDIGIDNGSTPGYWVANTTGLAAGNVEFTIANNFQTLQRLKFTITPDAAATMDIVWTVKGYIID